MISVIELGNKFSCEFAYKVNCKSNFQQPGDWINANL